MEMRPRFCYVGVTVVACLLPSAAYPATIGVDAIHAISPTAGLIHGAGFDTFRETIVGMGHTIVPMTSFDTQDLVGLDALILNQPWFQTGVFFTPSQIAAVETFVGTRAVFMGDSGIWQDSDTNSDTPISFADNLQLLINIINYISAGNGLLVLANAGTGSDVSNLNALVGPYGIQYSTTEFWRSGEVFSDLDDHPITQAVTTIGMDFGRSVSAVSPSMSLTDLSDNPIAVLIPEPTTFSLTLAGLACLVYRRQDGRFAT